MTTAEILTVAAIVLGPILAVQVQKKLEVLREKRNRKMRVFEILMTTRGGLLQLSPDHVQALNMIQLEFSAAKPRENDVRKAWRVYLDHLNTQFDPVQPTESVEWGKKQTDLFVDLLEKMARAVGYDFDKVLLGKEWYTPQAYGNAEREQSRIRAGALALLEGGNPLKVAVVGTRESVETNTKQDDNQQATSNA